MTSLHNGPAAAVKPRLIYGNKLQLQLAALPTTFRALLGHEWQSGTVALSHASPRQAAEVMQVPMALVRTIRQATPLEVEALKRRALTVEEVRRQQLANRRPSDTDIDRFIKHAGAGRVLDGLDRATRPSNGAATTNGHDPANDNNEAAAVALAQLLELSL
jgi:hypothetical protein